MRIQWVTSRAPGTGKPDPTKPRTCKRLRDEAGETRRRIAAFEHERRLLLMMDSLWGQLFGGMLRILLVHLRALQLQFEEFEKGWPAGEDPVAAVNRCYVPGANVRSRA